MPRLKTLSLEWEELTGLEMRALGNLPKLDRLVLNGRTIGQDTLSRIRVMAKKSQRLSVNRVAVRSSPASLEHRSVTDAAPASHPIGKVVSKPTPEIETKVASLPKHAYKPIALPRDLPASAPASKQTIDLGPPKGEGMILEVNAGPAFSGSKKRLTGLKRLHQIELTQNPRDLDLQPGADPTIQSSEPNPANSLGEFTVNSR